MEIKDEWCSAARRCGSVRTRDSEQARECVRAGGGSGGVDRSTKLSPTALQQIQNLTRNVKFSEVNVVMLARMQYRVRLAGCGKKRAGGDSSAGGRRPGRGPH
ncbi:unnamed protein product [Pieris macdunnoughi]|uniref:Uncharacterized protein n=1 Tax=Pieris macdunnoughi TaxID=345717 RepID=A0A821NQQ4_9NEOP|nr:unnamed protein product [Pieris macdunnoughi]